MTIIPSTKRSAGAEPARASNSRPAVADRERAQYEPDYFRAYVLDLCGAVHTKPARDITQEAGDAEAHIGGIRLLR